MFWRLGESGNGDKAKDAVDRAVLQGHNYTFRVAANSRELKQDVEFAELVGRLAHPLEVVQVVRPQLASDCGLKLGLGQFCQAGLLQFS